MLNILPNTKTLAIGAGIAIGGFFAYKAVALHYKKKSRQPGQPARPTPQPQNQQPLPGQTAPGMAGIGKKKTRKRKSGKISI